MKEGRHGRVYSTVERNILCDSDYILCMEINGNYLSFNGVPLGCTLIDGIVRPC